MSASTYADDVRAAPKLELTPRQFETQATFAGWDLKTIKLFLTPPLYSGYVMLGRHAVRVVARE